MNFIKTSGAVATGVLAASIVVGTVNYIASKFSSKSDDDNNGGGGSTKTKKNPGRPKKSSTKSNSKSGK